MFGQRTNSAVECTCAFAGTQYLPFPTHEEDQHSQLRSRHAVDAARDQPPDPPQSGARARADLARRACASHEDRARHGHLPDRGAHLAGRAVRGRHGRLAAWPSPADALRPDTRPPRRGDRHPLQQHVHHADGLQRQLDRHGHLRHDRGSARARARVADARAAPARHPWRVPAAGGNRPGGPGDGGRRHRSRPQRPAARVAQRRHPGPARGSTRTSRARGECADRLRARAHVARKRRVRRCRAISSTSPCPTASEREWS